MQTLEFINNSFLFKLLILTLNKRLKKNINQTSVELKNKIFLIPRRSLKKSIQLQTSVG
ncbi:hypothetical protein UUU_15110 [Klebsiella pneumoniae subsp. pneumoniae DSM 30104 = JCM 1662 = NBRC 14940]|nr:hypothetical protein UUU_15110 [Klebsiella pneumoniae subsp. pneumoniae DSM 30104 = JCM 1662 = NBRC 14940]